MADISQLFDKAYKQKEFARLADVPVDATQRLSENGATGLKEALLGVDTVRGLAEHKSVRVAQAATGLSC